MELVYVDDDILVCIKPAGALSTDEPGGVPELARQALGDSQADVRTVHRLDRVVAGLMVLARNPHAASELSRQVRENEFSKSYLAWVYGSPEQDQGRLLDLLCRDKARKMTMVASAPGKGVQEASLRYRVLRREKDRTLVQVMLETGRTHQIRVQFASRGMPLVGERKYSTRDETCGLALWSYHIGFVHPVTGENLSFYREPPKKGPWAWEDTP